MLPQDRYIRKVMGCWLGKAIGGTLGMPYEGREGPFDLTFYNPVPKETVSNDDLDLQVLWAYVLDRMATPRVNRQILADAWVKHVGFPWDEYGVSIRNLKLGLRPPLTGSYDNYFINGMGAAIRTEIWACLAPGNPKLAAAYAYEDACVDHADEGLWATVFLAALESAAFCESNPDKLLDDSIKPLSESSLVRQCIIDTRRWFAMDGDYLKTRLRILENYGHENFTDVVQNIGFIVLGWLAGNGDFSRAICYATNCGKDADCTAATVGALMGILNPDGIDEKWLAPIGRKLIVSKEIRGIEYPETLDGFTELIANLRSRLGEALPPKSDNTPQSTKPFEWKVNRTFIESQTDRISSYSFLADTLSKTGEQLTLPGAFTTMQSTEFTKDTLVIRYTFCLKEQREVRVVFNCSSSCSVWVDGQFVFSRNGGRMAPSAHRCPPDQFKDMKLNAGKHELLATIQRPTDKKNAQWVFYIADAKDKQWLTDIFCKD